MQQIKLSKRLQAVADLIDNDASVADIGTDHGHLPVYIAQTFKVKKIIASDISAASLDKARKSATENNVIEAITFLVMSGLSGVAPAQVDTIIITGLGGETIIQILKDAPWTNNRKIKLILQPQSKIDVLFRFLYDNDYENIETKYVSDKGKRYIVIVVNQKILSP